jgi:uncharacterized protein YegL
MSDIEKYKGKDLTTKIDNKIKLGGKNLSVLSKALTKSRPRIYYQLVIFVIDGSQSMRQPTKEGISKAKAVHNSIVETLERLNQSKNRECFDLCFIYYSDNHIVDIVCQNLTSLDQNYSFNPMDKIESRGTFATGALENALSIGRKYSTDNGQNDYRVLVNLLSDGSFDDLYAAKKVIQKIQKEPLFELSCQYFEREINENSTYYDWDEANDQIDESKSWTPAEVKARDKTRSEKFREFVTKPELFLTSTNPERIRNHMIKSISLVSKLLD